MVQQGCIGGFRVCRVAGGNHLTTFIDPHWPVSKTVCLVTGARNDAGSIILAPDFIYCVDERLFPNRMSHAGKIDIVSRLMDLQDAYLDWHPIEVDELAIELIVDAQERISSFRANSPRISSFETSNFHAAAGVLQGVKEQNLAPGIHFCELGCGFGVVTCLASMLGYEAYGIEIEQSLLEGGISLASDYNLSCHFVLGSYRPVNHVNPAMNSNEAKPAPGFSPFDFDLVYAYP